MNFFSIFEILKQYIKYCKDKKSIHQSKYRINSRRNRFYRIKRYSSTKGALKSLTQCLAIEFASKNIDKFSNKILSKLHIMKGLNQKNYIIGPYLKFP